MLGTHKRMQPALRVPDLRRPRKVPLMDYATNKLYNDSLAYLEGRGVPKDEARSFTLNHEAAKAGLGDAILAMGWYYLNAVGVARDLKQAKIWYKKSARLREPRAMFSLGQIAYDEKDWSDARLWFKRASDLGHHRSLYWLGKLYWRGRGVTLDQHYAKSLWQQAAHKKVLEAQRTIRMLFSQRTKHQTKG